PGQGGGGAIDNFLGLHRVAIINSILAGNTCDFGPDVNNSVVSLGNNLVGKTDGSSGWVGSDLTGTIAAPLDPRLGALASNGGPTQTMALLPGSPAIGGGTASGAPSTDQRGQPRTGHVDIGAFQSQGFILTPVAGRTPQSITVGQPFAQPL